MKQFVECSDFVGDSILDCIGVLLEATMGDDEGRPTGCASRTGRRG